MFFFKCLFLTEIWLDLETFTLELFKVCCGKIFLSFSYEVLWPSYFA